MLSEKIAKLQERNRTENNDRRFGERASRINGLEEAMLLMQKLEKVEYTNQYNEIVQHMKEEHSLKDDNVYDFQGNIIEDPNLMM